MAVLCPSYVSCLHSLSTCSSQLAALPLYVLLSLPWGCKIPSHFSSPGTGSDLFHFSYVVILTWIKKLFFSVAFAPCHFSVRYWCASASGTDNHEGPGIEAVGAWPPPWVEWDKQVRQCLSAELLPGRWGWECIEKCRITNLYLKGNALPLKALACSLGNLGKTKKQWLWW